MAERISALERVSGPAFRFRNSLEGRFYVLRFLYNARFDYWTFEVQGTDGAVVRGGHKINEGEDLLSRYSEAGLPPGTMFVVDSEGLDLDPGRFDLGARVRLEYTPAAEVV